MPASGAPPRGTRWLHPPVPVGTAAFFPNTPAAEPAPEPPRAEPASPPAATPRRWQKTASAPAGAGFDLSVFVQIGAALGSVAEALKAEQEWRSQVATVIRQAPISPQAIALSGGAGTLQSAQSLGVPQGYFWSVRRLSATGFTEGSVNITIDGGELVAPFPQAGVYTFAPGDVLIHPMSQLVAIATGITGSVVIAGASDLFETWYLPYYLSRGGR